MIDPTIDPIDPHKTCDGFVYSKDLGVAPTLPNLPDNLPLARRGETGVFLPKPLDHAVYCRLLLADWFKPACQAELDNLKLIHESELKKQTDLIDAIDTAFQIEQEKKSIDWSDTFLISALTGVVGFVGGILLIVAL